MSFLGLGGKKRKKKTQQRRGPRTFEQRVKNAEAKLWIKLIEEEDPETVRAVLSKYAGREMPRIDPVEAAIAKSTNKIVTRSVNTYLGGDYKKVEHLGEIIVNRRFGIESEPKAPPAKPTPVAQKRDKGTVDKVVDTLTNPQVVLSAIDLLKQGLFQGRPDQSRPAVATDKSPSSQNSQKPANKSAITGQATTDLPRLPSLTDCFVQDSARPRETLAKESHKRGYEFKAAEPNLGINN